MKINDLRDKKIAILGFGVENQALLKWLIKNDVQDITILDKKEIKISNEELDKGLKFQKGEEYLDNLEKFDIIFRTPGFPLSNPELLKAKKSGVEISSQIKLFFELCQAKIIGVTGTKGKGTTSTLIYKMLKAANKNVFLAGNIGNAPIEFLDELKNEDWVVLELSSFQLQDLHKSPYVAVVLNITSDHLDYHKDNTEYIEAKSNIVKWQNENDIVVANVNYKNSKKFAEESMAKNKYFINTSDEDIASIKKGVVIRDKKIILLDDNEEYELVSTDEIFVPGIHNWENISSASIAAYAVGVNIEVIRQIIKEFRGLKFRIELVAEIDGVKYYNDSASTNPDTTVAAIKSFSKPIVLIAGGSDKGADYSQLGLEISNSSVKTVILMGVTGSKIEESIRKSQNIPKIERVKSLQDAVVLAKKETEDGNIILFSPASASFDMFRDYKDRGEQFNTLIKNS